MSCVTTGWLRGRADHVAPADVEVVGEADDHRHRREGLVHRTGGPVDGGDGRLEKPDGSTTTASPGFPDAPGDLPGVPAVVVVFVGAGPDHVLHREAAVDRLRSEAM